MAARHIAVSPLARTRLAAGKTDYSGVLRCSLDTRERSMLRRLTEEAHVFQAARQNWLLIPADAELLDFLAEFEVERGEDIGLDCHADDDSDFEPEASNAEWLRSKRGRRGHG